MASIVTHVTVVLDTDWASFDLKSAGATIGKDPNFLYPLDAVFSKTGLFFGKKESFVYQQVTLKFYIINDGTAVTFVTAHGDEGKNSSGQVVGGQITATFTGNTYTNNTDTGDHVNSKTFFDAPVGTTPD